MILKELTEFYMPEKILHREEHLNGIREIFKQFNEFGTAHNLIIQGFSGTGKTTIINKVLSEQKNHFIFVSGAQQITAHQILRAITDLTFNTRERLLAEAIRKFKNNPVVIIVEEINKLKRTEEIKWLFNDLNTLYRETGCPIIIITNMKEIFKIIPNDARLTLFFSIVEFKPYNPIELKDIIEERINLINKNSPNKINIPESFLPYICAKTFKEGEGSARLALFLTKECIISNDFSEENVEKLLKKMRQGEWEQFICDMPEVEKKFLSLLISIAENKKVIPLGDIVKKIKNYPPQRISQLINSLESYGIIERESSEKDKRMKDIKFVSDDLLKKLGELTCEITPIM